jgi:hypothetical protein
MAAPNDQLEAARLALAKCEAQGLTLAGSIGDSLAQLFDDGVPPGLI